MEHPFSLLTPPPPPKRPWGVAHPGPHKTIEEKLILIFFKKKINYAKSICSHYILELMANRDSASFWLAAFVESLLTKAKAQFG